MTFYVPFGCTRHYGHQTMVKHHHSQRTSSFWVSVWRTRLFGQQPRMHGFQLCLDPVLVELPSFTVGISQVSRLQIWRWSCSCVAHWCPMVTFRIAGVAFFKETSAKEMVLCQMAHVVGPGLGPWDATRVLAWGLLNKVKLPKGHSKAKGKSLKLQCTCSQRVCMCSVCSRV